MIKKKIFGAALFGLLLCQPFTVYGELLDYEAVVAQSDTGATVSELEDGEGNTVKMAAQEDLVYVTTKDAVIRSLPGESGEELRLVLLGSKMQRTGVCDNGWSQVTYEEKGEEDVTGFIQNEVLSDQSTMVKFTDSVTVKEDSDILDYPGRKDGEVVGEVLELDEVTRTGTVDEVWSRILYEDENGEEQTGYIPTASLDGDDTTIEVESADGMDEEVEAGVLHQGEGGSIFSDAEEEIADVDEAVNGVQIGSPMTVASDASLVSLGVFRITHYCPCSICCGPWADGVTATGAIATTNYTIAVDPTQIPYGSKVVINGQVYVAEDCGGAIKQNCIDIYVATHEEGEERGVYYTEVYLLQ